MTNDKMDLHALVGKTADGDFLRDMIGFAAQRLMELEVGDLTGAAYGDKDPERLAQRNGYRDRDWERRAGTVEIQMPIWAQAMCLTLQPTKLYERTLDGRTDNGSAQSWRLSAIVPIALSKQQINKDIMAGCWPAAED